MSFTDKDLRRLEKWVADSKKSGFTGANLFGVSTIASIIARLEAAEKALDHNVPTDPDYIAWRKAAGK